MAVTSKMTPTDPLASSWPTAGEAVLQRELEEARRQLAQRDQHIAERDQRIAELAELYELAKERVLWFRQQVYGRRSERIPRRIAEQFLQHFGEVFGFETPEGVQGEMDPEPTGAGAAGGTPEDEGRSPGGDEKGSEQGDRKTTSVRAHERKLRKGHGRKPFPEGLPRVVLRHELAEHERLCEVCGDPKVEIGVDQTKLFEFLASLLYLMVHARVRYACPKSSCQKPKDGRGPSQPVTAPLPLLPIPKGRAGPGLLAEILVSKYEDNLPLHRQLERFRRHGITLPESTFGDWVAQSAVLLGPLAAHIAREVLLSVILQTDDTRLPVLPDKRPPGLLAEDRVPQEVVKGHLWAYRGDDDHPYVAFHFTPDWSAKTGPGTFLAEYRGRYLQADAYKGYDSFFEDHPQTEEAGCWAHARRKVRDAHLAAPGRVQPLLAHIQELYRIEKRAKKDGLAPEARKELRQREAKPVFTKIRAWIDAIRPSLTPKSLLGKAVTYIENQWAALNRYLEDGRLEIDNNATERDLRRIASGRKAWNFAGSNGAAVRAADIYTVITSAKRCGVDLHGYLRTVLSELPRLPRQEGPERQAFLDSLLPNRWAAAQAERKGEGLSSHVGPELVAAFLSSLTLTKPEPSKPP